MAFEGCFDFFSSNSWKDDDEKEEEKYAYHSIIDC